MKFFRTLLCFLVLSAYAGCAINPSSSSTLSYISSSQQNGVGSAGQSQDSTQQAQQLPMKTLSINAPDGKVSFQVQVAATEAQRTVGLMFRQSMPMDEGMIFLFDNEQPLTFWMKNTLIPLDMVFMDKNWKIVSIQKQAQPCKTVNPESCVLYPASQNGQYVLEINGGLSDKLGIQAGETAQLQ